MLYAISILYTKCDNNIFRILFTAIAGNDERSQQIMNCSPSFVTLVQMFMQHSDLRCHMFKICSPPPNPQCCWWSIILVRSTRGIIETFPFIRLLFSLEIKLIWSLSAYKTVAGIEFPLILQLPWCAGLNMNFRKSMWRDMRQECDRLILDS